jgi:hypothetical protein
VDDKKMVQLLEAMALDISYIEHPFFRDGAAVRRIGYAVDLIKSQAAHIERLTAENAEAKTIADMVELRRLMTQDKDEQVVRNLIALRNQCIWNAKVDGATCAIVIQDVLAFVERLVKELSESLAENVRLTAENERLRGATSTQMTLSSWMSDGPRLVREGVRSVHIADRWPTHVADRVVPEGGYGWQYGWRWQDEASECSRWTLPEEIYNHLPPCPYGATSGVMKRWPTIRDAQAALAVAALIWAEKLLRDGGKGGAD